NHYESKRRARPAALDIIPGEAGARAEPSSTRAEELLLLRFLGLLRLFRLLRFLSHSILSGFNGLKRDTRGMLGGGPASQYPQQSTQQIRAALPRAVTPVTLRYPQSCAFCRAFFPKICNGARAQGAACARSLHRGPSLRDG